MKIIGLDVGEKRIGVAKVDSNTRIAVPVGFLLADGSEWQEIARIAGLSNTNFFVLGLPRSNEGNETKQSQYVRRFAQTLTEKIPGARVRFQDESLTSVEAEKRLKARKKRYERGDIDAEAATIILQDFIENFANSSEPVLTASINAAPMPEKKSHKLRNSLIAVAIVLALGAATGVGALAWRKEQLRQREEMWAALEAEQVPDVFNFTIRPGETIFDVRDNLIELGYDATEVEQALKADYSGYAGLEFLAERPAGATLEGYLYGETHEFYKEATVEEILTTFLLEMGRIITENNLEARYAEQGLSLFEGITLASMVQKEAATADQPTVAQVFLKRYREGIPLGSDVTVSYALDIVDPDRISYPDNQAALQIDECHNTRRYGGLPCGPIASPSLSALLAVAEPNNTAYLYFLTGDDGRMYYSYTGSEHLQNIAAHCQELCQVSL